MDGIPAPATPPAMLLHLLYPRHIINPTDRAAFTIQCVSQDRRAQALLHRVIDIPNPYNYELAGDIDRLKEHIRIITCRLRDGQNFLYMVETKKILNELDRIDDILTRDPCIRKTPAKHAPERPMLRFVRGGTPHTSSVIMHVAIRRAT